MKKKLIAFILALVAVAIVTVTALVIRSNNKDESEEQPKVGDEFNDPNALPWDPV